MDMPMWFMYLFDIAIVVAVILGWMFWQRAKYASAVKGKMIADIWMANGYSVRELVDVDISERWVNVDDFEYMLNPQQRRFAQYPEAPFLNLKWLQVTTRIESWQKDNPEPIRPSYDALVVTSAEIKAMTREIQATTAAMQIQEIDARQKELTRAITNQPSKNIVYIGLLAVIGVSIGIIIMLMQVGADVGTILQGWGLG